MVSPSRSRLRRTTWYTALALASFVLLFLPQTPPARGSASDDTPPVVVYTIDGVHGTNNWYRGSLSGNFIVVHWSVSDPESTITSTTGCEQYIQIPGPNTGTTRTCSATSAGGTTTVTTKLLKIDADPPVTTATTSRPPNGAGWYRSPFSIGWSGTDATSGIASCRAPLRYSGPDTGGSSVGGSCTDNAGNTSSDAVLVRYDSVPPATFATSSPSPNAAGWFHAPLSVSWHGSDALSGIAFCSPARGYNGPDTAGTAEGGTCTDNAGNSSSAALTVRYDTTAPTIESLALRTLDRGVKLKWQVSGAQRVLISRSTKDGKSATGLYGGRGTTLTDRRLRNYTQYRYTLTAQDEAGNTATRSATATPMPDLFAPRPAAHLARHISPLFAWRPAPRARYYNLQLWRAGHKVGSWWPSQPRLRLSARWTHKGGVHRLSRGSYSWYVWPGLGARRLGHYGPLLGKSTFAVD